MATHLCGHSSVSGGHFSLSDAEQLQQRSVNSRPLVACRSKASTACSKSRRSLPACSSNRSKSVPPQQTACNPDQPTASQPPQAEQTRRNLLTNMSLLALTLQTGIQIAPDPATAALVQFPTTHLRNRYILVRLMALCLGLPMTAVQGHTISTHGLLFDSKHVRLSTGRPNRLALR